MADYIERQAALHAVNEFFHDPKVDIAIKNVPTVNVQEESITEKAAKCIVAAMQEVYENFKLYSNKSYVKLNAEAMKILAEAYAEVFSKNR